MYQRKKKAIGSAARILEKEIEDEGVIQEEPIKEVSLKQSCQRCLRVSVVLSTVGFYILLTLFFVICIVCGIEM